LNNPQDVVPESVMPKYAFLGRTPIDGNAVGDLMWTHSLVGVPYTSEMIELGQADFAAQADPDADTDALLVRYPGAVISNFDGQPQLTEMDALIAYLQILGTMVDFSTFTPDASR
jgi:cytochrome c oxidase cbb3-type subunit 2